MNPMILTILRRERRIRQARAFRRACAVALLVFAVIAVVLGTAQSLDMIHLQELSLLAQTVTP